MKDLLTVLIGYFEYLGALRYFAADISYHKSYYVSFRSPWWKKKIENINTTKDTVHNSNRFYELFSSVQFHIVDRHEVYTLEKFRNIDLKNKLKEKFKQKLKFLKPTHFSLTSASEFVVSSADSVLPNCLSKVLLRGGILKSLLIKNYAKAYSVLLHGLLVLIHPVTKVG